jgi:hypothetical protein
MAAAQTVTRLQNQPPSDGVIYGFLLTDGSVLYQGGNVTDWYKFTPDAFGNYLKGTWSTAASLPASYGPYATGGGVLPDGRVLLTGGEYLLNAAGTKLNFALTTQNAIYDPLTNKWTVFSGPAGWIAIGDSPGTVLPNGLFYLREKVTTAMAVFNPSSLTWTLVNETGKSDVNAEEGWTVLPDGTAITEDVTNAPNSERYFPGATATTGGWTTAGSTVANLKFVWTGKNALPLKYKHDGKTYEYTPAGEIGPAILRPDGTVFATGAINKGATAGHTAIWTPGATQADPGTWAAGPDFQAGDDAGDEFAVLLPNGHVLVEANTDGSDQDHDSQRLARRQGWLLRTGTPMSASVSARAEGAPAPQAKKNPCTPNPLETYHLYEFDGTHFTEEAVDVTTCGNSLSLLTLPTGQAIVGGVGLYSSAGSPQAAWAPTVTTAPARIAGGSTYTVSGTQFTGLSQAAEYGDEFPTPTDYPLVRITNTASGHVVYARTHTWSSSAVATGSAIVSSMFDVPAGIQSGASTLQVVANGIASAPVRLTVQ